MCEPESIAPPAPIAVVGLSCRLPGGANDPAKLWQLLTRNGVAWSPVPSDRFNEAAFYHPSGDDTNGTSNHKGGYFINADSRDFDHSFFRLSPQQAAAMDPQQRMLLEMSYEALENSGWSLESCAGSNTAVYAASFTADFERNLYRDPVNLPVYYLTGVEKAILSNRISHAFDLHGPSMTIDTACSGGLVAVHQACQSLRTGESDAAIVAAANLTMGPDQRIGMSTLHLTSGAGHCYPFDSRGDGYGRGEGCVVFVLKRLDQALRDRDPVRAILRNTAVNQDGYTPASITYPNGAAQEQLIRNAYARVGLSPLDVSYVEAHGTGTRAGDFEELTAIAKVFASPNSDRSTPLYVGSIKGNIGHTENTSGLASMVKAILMLNHLQIPATAGLHEFKPGLPIQSMCIPTDLTPWPRGNSDNMEISPRVSINSFGFGGANAHAILERAPRQISAPRSGSAPGVSQSCLFTLSANSQTSLQALISTYHTWIKQHSEVELGDLSYTLCRRRSILPWRFSCVADNWESLLSKLQAGMGASAVPPPRDEPALVFIFTGQGAQWLGMARELLLEESVSPVFRDSIHASRDVFLDLGADWDLEQELLRPPTDATLLNTAQLAQPVTTAIQIALIALLRSFGIAPRVVIGHSSGEIAAAHAASYLSARQALTVAYHRGFMADAAKARGLAPGAMLSVGLGEAEAIPFTKNLSKGVASIACVNSPSSVTISGDAEAVDEVSARLAASNSQGDATIFYRRLVVDTAYHSHHMRAVADEYRARLGELDFNKQTPSTEHTEVTFISSVTGTLKSSGFGPEYWIDNLVSPVRFSDAVQKFASTHADNNQHSIFLEIGPHSALAGPVRQCLMDSTGPKMSYDYYSVLQRKVDAITSTLTTAGHLFVRGVPLDLRAMSAVSPPTAVGVTLYDLPSYTWDHSQKHYFESRISREYRFRSEPYHDLLGVRAMDATSIEPRWRHMIGLNTLPWLEHHIIDSQIVFPGSGYLCMAIEALRQIKRERHPQQRLVTIALRDVSFLRGLVVSDLPGQRTEAQLSFTPQPGTVFTFDFRITAHWDGEWHEHCRGIIHGMLAMEDGREEADDVQLAYLASGVKSQLSPEAISIDPKELYHELTQDGNFYGQTFRGIRSYSLEVDDSSAIAAVEVPDTAALMPAQYQQPHLIHPTTLDIVLHTCLPMVSHYLGRGSIMPVHIGEILVSATPELPHEPSSELNVSTMMRSSHYRTAHTDVCVTAHGQAVLVASGVELMSLSSNPSAADGVTDGSGICYELDWRPDLEFLRAQDVSMDSKLIQVIRHVLYKSANLSALEIGAGHADLSLAFLGCLDGHEDSWPAYEYAADSSASIEKTRKQLVGYPVHYRTFAADSDLCDQGFKPQSYSVVLISTLQSLGQARSLIDTEGVVIMELKIVPDDDWASLIRDASLHVQLSVYDTVRSSLVILARPKNTEQVVKLPQRITMLTHSDGGDEQPWVTQIEHWLQAGCSLVSREPLHASRTFLDLDNGERGNEHCFIVVEDQITPILSDPNCFNAIISLLKQSSRIVWISPSDPLPMHQITGVARTAHAENENLSLTTVHVAPQLLSANNATSTRLLDILALTLDPEGTSQEREYLVDKAGTVLIPRLLSEHSLDHAIRRDTAGRHEVERSRFLDDSRTLALAVGDLRQLGGGRSAIFHETGKLPVILADDEVEVETRAFTLSKSGLKASYCTYAGVVTQVGASVNHLSPGEHVVAISTTMGANRLVVPQEYVGRLPAGTPPAVGARTALHIMAAYHALHGLARLPSKGRILIHGALTASGRATLAVARSIGATVAASATGQEDARRMIDELQISPELIVIIRQSKSPRNVSVGGVDAVIQADTEDVPSQILAYLKPFGSVVVLGLEESSLEGQGRLSNLNVPRNSAVFFCDIVGLLIERPDMASSLVAHAAETLSNLPFLGLDECVRPVDHAAKALRLIETGVCDWVVLQADANPNVPVALRPHKNSDWNRQDASYLITGGLGDLGRRLLGLMAQRGAKHLITLSRRACSVKDHLELQGQLRVVNPGCSLYCLTCDITQEESVQQAAERLHELGLPPVRGIVQSAALLKDRTLDTMTYEDFLLATRVKVAGTLALEKTFASPHLAFFLMLSSAVNVLGASGQANYNAGNSVQDAVSWARKGGHCRYMSLSPGWIEDAAFTVDDESRLNGLRRAGLRPISHDELSRYLDYALGAGEGYDRPAQAVIGFDTISLANATTHNGTVRSPMFCHVRASHSSPAVAGTTPSSADEVMSFAQAMAGGDSDFAKDFVATSVASRLERLISIEINRIDPRKTSILDLGVDSLISIELRNWIMREFDAPLQSSEILVDQTIYSLAEKIVFRSKVAPPSLGHESSGDNDSLGTSVTTLSDFTAPTLEENSKDKKATVQLPNLPRQPLEDTLELFEMSRQAVDSAEEQAITATAIRHFLDGPGPTLQRLLDNMPEATIAEAYEHDIYLKRREPLQDYSTFFLVHPITAPSHSQTVRATVLTVAAIDFARRLAAGEMALDELHGRPLDGEPRNWLFHTTRRPGSVVDYMERHPWSHNIVVLRRGHIFQITLPDPSEAINLSAIHATYRGILDLSEDPQVAVSSFTADERKSWAHIRSELEQLPENADALNAIDKCAFVVCLDDEVPETGGERHMQFLLNGRDGSLSNRWLDKPFQLAVTANGLSAGIYEHTKLDGIDVRSLHHHLTESLFSHGERDSRLGHLGSEDLAYPFREFSWKVDEKVVQHISQIQLRGSSYGIIDHRIVQREGLGFNFLRAQRAPPNATAHFTVLLAIYLVDGEVRPAWEIVSLAPFSRGRIDWVQTVTPAVRTFIEAAATAAVATDDPLRNIDTRADLRALFDAATMAHARLISTAGSGRGYVKQMYALLGALKSVSNGVETELPALFRTHAWDATRRGGPGQDLKIGFMANDGEHSEEWDEGGFFMEGDRGVYVHCDVEEHRTKFIVSAQAEYAARVCEALGRATDVINTLLT
ncbi:Lovastatin diketide synthase LovF [Cytospora mali]|uniref:Lovastatin diketide synthase LovF n=1 Tax=Cytospora mali TaxID=578113 RepID=A0A194V9E2_CYTMA|nr:Lovastatin diketide synthase LovF [Valsa mali var. pyri (nom. inval.)]